MITAILYYASLIKPQEDPVNNSVTPDLGPNLAHRPCRTRAVGAVAPVAEAFFLNHRQQRCRASRAWSRCDGQPIPLGAEISVSRDADGVVVEVALYVESDPREAAVTHSNLAAVAAGSSQHSWNHFWEGLLSPSTNPRCCGGYPGEVRNGVNNERSR